MREEGLGGGFGDVGEVEGAHVVEEAAFVACVERGYEVRGLVWAGHFKVLSSRCWLEGWWGRRGEDEVHNSRLFKRDGESTCEVFHFLIMDLDEINQ